MSKQRKTHSDSERGLRRAAPVLFGEDSEPIDPLDLSIILLNAVEQGMTTESSLAKHCLGGEGKPNHLPVHFCSVLRQLVEDGFLREVKLDKEHLLKGTDRSFELTDFGRSSISLE